MKKLPWLAFFPKDLFGSSRYATMTLPEQGAYLNLLFRSWLSDEQGYLPITDEFHLKKLSGWMEYENQETAVGYDALGNFSNVLDMFATDENGRLYSPRLIEAKDERARYGEAKSFAGQQSAKKRAEKRQREANRPSTGKQQRPSTSSTRGQPSEIESEIESETETDKEKKQSPPTAGAAASDKPTERGSGNNAKTGIAEAFVKIWNASGLRKCMTFSPSRANALRTRLKDSFWKQNWQAALKRASGIPGLSGANGRNWRADIDWFLKPDNVAKLMEGKYDGWNDGVDGKRIKPQSRPQASKWDDPKWNARQAKIHDLWARKKLEAKEKGEPEPKSPQGYDPKWKPKGAKDSGGEDEKLPF